MKKGLVVVFLFILMFTAVSILAASECRYSAKYDKDGDRIMNTKADCGTEYPYDCDDSDKDVYKECENSLWERIKNWFRSASQPRGSNLITSDSVKIIPGPGDAKDHVKRVIGEDRLPPKVHADYEVAGEDCAATICYNDQLREIYCPLDHDDCCEKYSECRIIPCDDEYCEDETPVYDDGPESDVYTDAYDDDQVTGYATYEEDTYGYESDASCMEEYHDCFDQGEAVICKGLFEDCDESFQDCTCGMRDLQDSYVEQAQPDFNTEETVECSTGTYV